MSAATKARATPRKLGLRRGFPIAAGAKCFAGTMAALEGGVIKPAMAATGLVIVGLFVYDYDNTGGADGAFVAEVERGIFALELATTSGDEITIGDVGKICYAADNQSVGLTDGSGTRSPAGVIDDVDVRGIWVRVDPSLGPLV